MLALQNAANCAMREDYLNAVTNMGDAAAATGFKLPPKPFGMPDIIRGTVWMKWRAYYHNHSQDVFAHVHHVLEMLSQGGMDSEPDEE
jgi:hypothetical protein